MSERRLWVVSFDISNNSCRQRVGSALLAYLERVQESVFEGYMTLDEATALFIQLRHDLDDSTDKITFFPVCNWCETKLRIIGLGERSVDHQFYWV